MDKKDRLINEYKKYLKEAGEKGWWIACLYWSNKLDKLDNEEINLKRKRI